MNLTTRYNRIVRLTWASTYTPANFIEDLNVVKDRFWSKIVSQLDEDRHYQEWTIDWWTTALQSEYSLVTVSTTSAWTKVLKWVAVNYDWDTYTNTGLMVYKNAREVNRQTLANEWNYYLENQSVEDPIYFIADNSIFIAPVPTSETAWANRLKLIGIRNIADYDIDTTEAQMIIPTDYIEVLMKWVIPYALMTKRVDNNEIVKAENDYLIAEKEALVNLSTRVEWPVFIKFPEDTTDKVIFNIV